jgi:hypothetical protein
MIVVEIQDHLKSYTWNENPYADWCREHCSNEWDILKYTSKTITGKFENENDATAFALRWT